METLKRRARSLWADRRGAIAPMAAVMLIPLMIGVGAAVDISRLVSSKTALQDAVDSAALAVARMPAGATSAEMQAKAQAWINANTSEAGLTSLVVRTPVRTLGQVQIDVSAQVPTTFAQILGVTMMDLTGHSTVKYGTSHVELALVLDNTGSMAQDGKLDALKTAAASLVDSLEQSSKQSTDPDALKIGVVPFSMTVNIGSGYQTQSLTQPWLVGKMPDAYGSSADVVGPAGVHPDRFLLFKALNNTQWKGCVESRPMPYDISDAAPDVSKPATLFVPFFAPDEPDPGYYSYSGAVYYHYSNTSGQISSNNNYLNDNYINTQENADLLNRNKGSSAWLARQTNQAKYLGAPKAGTNPVWGDAVGPNSGCNIASLQRLTTDMSAVRSKLTQMVATGDTEIPLGLVWGWHLLSPNGPFADGTPYNKAGTLKIVVLVTDGQNTYGASNNLNLSSYTAYAYAAAQRISGSGTAAATASALDDRLSQLCANMKSPRNDDGNDHVIIYTVPVGVTDANIKSRLQTCASKPEYYIDVANASGLQGAFSNIAGSISGLRVAH